MSLFKQAIFNKTLLCFLNALEGKEIIVELRNESTVTGLLVDVDSYMNLQLNEATLSEWGSNDKKHFGSLFIKGRQIRFVQSYEQSDARKTIEKQLKSYRNVKIYDERIKKKSTR